MDNKGKTLTRADLSNAVYREIGLSLSESGNLVDAFIEEISAAMENGEQVKLSSFGTFKLRHKKQRIGRNPKTGVEVPITPRTVLTFNASNILKQKVNKALGGDTGGDKAEDRESSGGATSGAASSGFSNPFASS